MKKFRTIAIVTSSNSWFIPYSQKLKEELEAMNYSVTLYQNHKNIQEKTEIVFLLSYFSIVENKFLEKHPHTFVVHESDLPKGKGWAPLFWQILDGKKNIPVTLIEASEKVDSGKIYLKDTINLNGYELHDEIRELQAKVTCSMCIRLVEEHEHIIPVEQTGEETFYQKRTPADSQLSINKSISDQFNLLRIVSNKEFPAFFEIDGYRYILKIEKAND